jgi:hypothetical protein
MSRTHAVIAALLVALAGQAPAHAQLSVPKGYVLHVGAATFAAPADATVYYIGGLTTLAPDATVGLVYQRVPKAGTIRAAYFSAICASGTSETSTVRLYLNGADSTVIASTLATNAPTTVSNTALSVPVAVGDLLAIKWTTPTWVTNPTNCPGFYGVIYVDVP